VRRSMSYFRYTTELCALSQQVADLFSSTGPEAQITVPTSAAAQAAECGNT
jgi:hypothetical protein